MTTFVGLATRIPQFSILVETLKFIDAQIPGSNLVGTLNDSQQNLTVFAPTDAAFARLAVDLGFDGNPHNEAAVIDFLTTTVGAELLNSVITYHVAAGRLSSFDIARAGTIDTLQGAQINAARGNDFRLTLKDQDPDFTDPRAIFTNIHVSNGILHVIDRVLLPVDLPPVGGEPDLPTIVGIAGGSDDFSILVAALGFIDSELGSDLVGTLDTPDGDFTVFAPTNAAFGQLATDLGFDGDTADAEAVTAFLVGVGAETLDTVVRYHVLGSAQTLADIATAGTVTTLQGEDIVAGPDGTLIDQEPDLADPTLVATDLPASNGIVHVIDRVLLPIDLPGNEPPQPTIADLATGNGDLSILVDVLTLLDQDPSSDLIGALSDPDASLTVFAPTNAAFGQLAVDQGFDGDPTDPAAVTAFLVAYVDLTLLRDVVTYHVAPGALTADDINSTAEVATLNGAVIGGGAIPSLVDNDPDRTDPTVIAANLPAANGIVHVIDRVLLPVDLPEPAEPTIVDVAASLPDFSILVAALGVIDDQTGSDLVGTLSNLDADLTVFAPTNAAFGLLAMDLGFGGDTADADAVTAFLLNAVGVDLLSTVVQYHVADIALTAADIAAAGTVDTLTGSIGTGELPTLTDGEPDLINPSLVETDIQTGNGIIHIIDRVLIPADLPGNDAPSITDIVAASGDDFDSNPADFDILLEAVKTAGLAETLAGDVDFTVFAPNDAAFVNLARDIGFDGTDEGDAWGYLVDALTVITKGNPIPLLTEVLTYHVIGQSLQASQVVGLDTIETLQGGDLTVEGTTLIDLDPDSFDANLIATDIQANNGIVHVIDEVLIPADLLAGDNTDLFIGADRNDHFHAGRGDDFVSGKGGNDYLLLGSGDDVGLGGDGRDLISGWSGDDHIDGGAGRDRLYGGRGEDEIKGGTGNDRIFGGSGDDRITGGEGHDRLFGGRGEDTFIFAAGDGQDVIRDFRLRDDQIDLSAYDFDGIDDLQISGNRFSTYIDLGNGDGIALNFVSANGLTDDNFIF